MRGKTHLAIGVAIGGAAALYYPFHVTHAAIYVTVAGFSALSPDLDGPSILTSKLSRASQLVRKLLLWLGALAVAAVLGMYLWQRTLIPELTTAAFLLFFLGQIATQGALRNLLSSIMGCIAMYYGWKLHMDWLIGLGIYVAIAPWLKHRGLTHTVWAMLLWGFIASGLENALQLDGVMAVAILGYFSHLLADTFTPRGVKWFHPLLRTTFRIRL
ncbi:metal-dependent hydrolase [Paenibacillus aquistagni]|uniref:Inner membrane protein n=1 Tax=Paenibacillus aquistagni TaxID=1852522 RepID=A0A1X7IUT1_9BACL|nr:metal-dependent hydrolase [Paenibacillus aquistagni]SMG18843.1 inner membrane protein [Paenibacillus aquistagni]